MIFSIFYILGFIEIFVFFGVIFQNVSPSTIFHQFFFLVHNMAKYIEKKVT